MLVYKVVKILILSSVLKMKPYCAKWFFIIIIHVVFGYNNHMNTQLKPSDEARIINGNVANASEVPSIVQLLVDIVGEPFCAGTLVTENRVLTAAHCVYDLNNET